MLSDRMKRELQEYVLHHLSLEENPALKDMDIRLMEYSESYRKSPPSSVCESAKESSLSDYISSRKEASFRDLLFMRIDEAGLSDSDVYKRAGIDRRLFSKIRSSAEYRPAKSTAIALCLALELPYEETVELLGSAGYTLSRSDVFDLVIQFCLEEEIYSLYDVNLALHHFNLKPLC